MQLTGKHLVLLGTVALASALLGDAAGCSAASSTVTEDAGTEAGTATTTATTTGTTTASITGTMTGTVTGVEGGATTGSTTSTTTGTTTSSTTGTTTAITTGATTGATSATTSGTADAGTTTAATTGTTTGMEAGATTGIEGGTMTSIEAGTVVVPPGCTLASPVSFKMDVQPFLATSCGNGGGGSGCHVLDAASTVANGGYDHAYDWITGTAHASSCPETPTPFRFQVVVAVMNQADPFSCSKCDQMPINTTTNPRTPLTACQMATLKSWLDEPWVTQMHRDDGISPTTPYPMPPFN